MKKSKESTTEEKTKESFEELLEFTEEKQEWFERGKSEDGHLPPINPKSTKPLYEPSSNNINKPKDK